MFFKVHKVDIRVKIIKVAKRQIDKTLAAFLCIIEPLGSTIKKGSMINDVTAKMNKFISMTLRS